MEYTFAGSEQFHREPGEVSTSLIRIWPGTDGDGKGEPETG